ncbi:hypothetical protein THRCLA_10153, partial [Thraustotheca clavata]
MVIKRKVNYQDDDKLLFQAQSIIALRCTKANGRYFVAQLLDDVTQSMLDHSNANVNVLYYDKQRNGKFKLRNYDVAPVRSIMCVIQLVEVNDNEFEIPCRYQYRVTSGNGITKILGKLIKPKKPTEKKSPPPKKLKISKNLPAAKGKCFGHVDDLIVDDEMHGNHDFREMVHDVLSSSKEVIRAVLTKNYTLLESLTTPSSPHIVYIHSLFAFRSVGIQKCALEYAIENNDVKFIELLLGTKDKEFNFATKPSTSLLSGMYELELQEPNDSSNKASNLKKKAAMALSQEHKHDSIQLQISDYHTFSTALWMKSLDILSLFYPGDALIQSAPMIITKLLHYGNIDVAAKLIEKLAIHGQAGYTPLHLQALQPTPIGSVLKEDILKKSDHGVTPLHLAALSIYPARLQDYLKIIDPKDLNCSDKSDWKPIHYATVNPSPHSIKILLHVNGNLNSKCKEGTPLHLACQYGHLDKIQLMLIHIPKQEVSSYLECYNHSGYRPLHIAAKYGFTSILNLLIDYGASVRGVTKPEANKMTALAIAAEAGHLECVTTLLNHGAPVDAVDKMYRTSLMYAVMNGHATIAKELLNRNANANAADKSRNTVMHYAASYGWLSCVKLLLSIGAESWSFNDTGLTPQVYAGLLCRYDVSHFLLDHLNDRSIDYENDDGATPLSLQCQYGKSVEEITYLLSKGADPNHCTKLMMYPLQQILLRMAKESVDEKPLFVDILRQLIARGAHTSGFNLEINRSPLVLAIQAKSKEVFDILLPLSIVTDDIWVTVIKSQYCQDLLETLIKSPHKISNGGPVLNAVATTCRFDPLPLSLFEKLLSKMNDIENAFLHYDDNGNVPIFTVMKNLRNGYGMFTFGQVKDTDYATKDLAASELFKIYLEKTKDITNLVGIGPLIDGKRYATTENLLHLAASHRSISTSLGKTLPETWKGINVLDTILQLKWPLHQVNADYNGSTPLQLAISRENIAGATKLIEMGADVNYVSTGISFNSPLPLWCAFQTKNAKLVELLLKRGANPSLTIARNQETLLHHAFKMGSENTACLQLLLDYGADVCAVDSQGRTPLSLAIISRKTVNCTKYFDGDLDYYGWKNSAVGDEFDFACPPTGFGFGFGSQTYLDGGNLDMLLSDKNIAKAIEITDNDGLTCFDHAKQRDDIHLQQVLRILSKKTIKQIPTQSLPTYQEVHDAICKRYWQLVFVQITNLIGSNRNSVLSQMDENRETLLHVLARKHIYMDKYERTIAFLLVEAGVDVTVVNTKQQTAMHVAAALGKLPFCRFYLYHAPQLLDQLSFDGNSPLLEAMTLIDVELTGTDALIYFIRQGANINIKNLSGHSALSLYIDRIVELYCIDEVKLLRIIQRVVERGADINGLFTTTNGKICSRHGSIKPRLTLLIRALYVRSTYLRQELLVMLLTYQCNRMEVDDDGNS